MNHPEGGQVPSEISEGGRVPSEISEVHWHLSNAGRLCFGRVCGNYCGFRRCGSPSSGTAILRRP